MHILSDFLKHLFLAGEFQPHGFCYQWNSGLVWLNVISDLLIALAYFTIPITLVWFVRKRRDMPFGWMFILFGVFIVACGTTHLMEVWNLWHAQYWLAGTIKAVTAAASVPTAILLTRLVPKALDLKSPEQWIQANVSLEKEIQERRELELGLRLSEASLRSTASLLDLTHDAIFVRNLKNEILFWNSAAEKLYGWKKEEVQGKTTHDLLKTVFPSPVAQIETQTLEKGLWEGELIHQRRDGTSVVVSSRWAVRTENGKPVAILESNRDVTQRIHEEEKFRNLLEAAPDAMVIVNRAGEIQLVNSQAEKLFGYPRNEILGKPVETLVPHRFHGTHETARTKYSESPRPREMGQGLELYGRRQGGEEFPVEISLSPIKTHDELLIASAIRDVSQRKKIEKTLRESEERFRLLVSGVRDYSIIMLDLQGRVSSWNAGAERIKGYKSEEILGQHFSRFYLEEDIKQGKPALELETVAKTGQMEAEGWRLRKDGTQFWAVVKITALYDENEKLYGFGKVTQDATERKKTEDAIREQSLQLAHSNAGLLEANRELESFSYSVSHDLRAPLRAIDGFSHALLEQSEKLDAEERNYLDRIRAATERMGLLIDALLNLARIARAQIKKQDLDLSAITNSVTAELQKAQPGRSVELRIEPDLRAFGDPALLQLVFENLFSNAWKFTSKRECAHIQFGKTERDGRGTFFVRDDGAGFDPAYADRLFGAFQRLHSMKEFPGTGVGLATVQRIINRHGGKIWAESALDQGTTFYFTIAEA